MIRLSAALAALACAAPAIADVAPGRYDSVPTPELSCTAASDGAIEVTPGRITFWESACDLTPVGAFPRLGNATVYDAQCRGEGETWNWQFLLMQSADGGLVMVTDGAVVSYRRCP